METNYFSLKKSTLTWSPDSYTWARERLVCLQFIFEANLKHNPLPILLPRLMCRLYFCSQQSLVCRHCQEVFPCITRRELEAHEQSHRVCPFCTMICDTMEQSVFEDHVYSHEVWDRHRVRRSRFASFYMSGEENVLQEPYWYFCMFSQIYCKDFTLLVTTFQSIPTYLRGGFQASTQPLVSIMCPVCRKNQLAETWNLPGLCNPSQWTSCPHLFWSNVVLSLHGNAFKITTQLGSFDSFCIDPL